VSVVILSWNTRDLLSQTLTSLYQQTHGVTFETIVVENGSSDGTREMIRQDWSQVRLVDLPENLGFAIGNNRAFERARGRYVLLLNSDTIVLPSTVPGLATFLDRHSRAACVGARLRNSDGTLQRSMGSFPGLVEDFLIYTELWRLPVLRAFLARRDPWWGDHDRALEIDWVKGACLMVRKTVIDQVGGFDDDHFLYAEEIDWCYRMRKAGWRVFFTPDAEVIHLGGRSAVQLGSERVVLLYESRYWFYRKHYSTWKYVVLRFVTTAVGSIRMVALTALCLLSHVGIATQARYITSLCDEPEPTGPCGLLKAWSRILRLPWDAGRRHVVTRPGP
jgi:GT2 family glycosyltransferase